MTRDCFISEWKPIHEQGRPAFVTKMAFPTVAAIVLGTIAVLLIRHLNDVDVKHDILILLSVQALIIIICAEWDWFKFDRKYNIFIEAILNEQHQCQVCGIKLDSNSTKADLRRCPECGAYFNIHEQAGAEIDSSREMATR
jgi:uncharacterized protein with PIN domain